MATKNILAKRLVLELFSAVCVYSDSGHEATLDALDYFKVFAMYAVDYVILILLFSVKMSKTKLHRFAILMSEMVAVDNVEYKAAILGFANSLILGTENIWTRHAIRSEMIGLGILEAIENVEMTGNPEICIQIQVFEHHRTKDEDNLDETDEKSLFDLFSLYFLKV